jgi:hypothetical protein
VEKTNPLVVTYSSDLIIPDTYISTLAIFMDTVWLPHVPSVTVTASVNEFYEKNRLLFDSKIFSFLPRDAPKSEFKLRLEKGPAQETLDGYNWWYENLDVYDRNDLDDFDRRLIHMIDHLGYRRAIGQQLFIREQKIKGNTIDLSTSLAHSLLLNFFPHIGHLTDEQILEIRDHVAQLREGFKDYIFTHTEDIEIMMNERDLTALEASQRLVERKIGPSYHEFRRKLESGKSGTRGKWLTFTENVMEIDASILSPKAWLLFAKATLGLVKDLQAEEEAALSNEQQAFTYLARLEKKVST